MMKKNTRKGIILFLSFILLFSSFPMVRSNGLTPHNPISIRGNDDFASKAASERWAGNGTESNPYIIEGYEIIASSAHGISIRDTDVYFIIRNCSIHGGGISYDGIHLYNVTNGKIENVTSFENRHGIWLSYSNYTNITNNIASGNSDCGIYLYRSSNNNITNNIASNNEGYFGIWVDRSSYNTVRDNIVSGNSWYGIYISYSNYNNITNNIVSGNEEYGIWLDHSSNNTVSNCNVYSNYDGIWIDYSQNNTITNCNVWNNEDGIWVGMSSDNTITYSNIYNNTDDGIVAYYAPNTQIHYCNIYGNADYGIYNSNEEEIYKVNATYCWWGHASGPYHPNLNPSGKGDNVSKNVLFDPWLQAPYEMPNQLPVASFTYEPLNPTIEDIIQFYDQSYDPDGEIISWSWDFGDGNVSNEQNPTHQYVVAGTYEVTLTVMDDDGATNSLTIPITVYGLNNPPVANDDYYETDEDVALTVNAPGVLGNDYDVDEDPLIAVLVTNPSHGTLTLNEDGSFTYTPALNYHGTDSFTYRAYDGTAYSNIATVYINITPVNDSPVAIDDYYETDEDTPLIIEAPGLLENDYDVDEDTLTAVLENGPSHGSLTLNEDGSFTYTPEEDYHGTDSFTYRAYDGTAYSNIATVYINITPGNYPPVANDDSARTALNFNVTINITKNDNDTDGTITDVIITQLPAHGNVIVNEDLTITYSPDANYYGLDSFKYKVKDNEEAESNEATVYIEVYMPEIRIVAPPSVEFGEEFTVDIIVDAENVLMVQCYLEFNASLIEAIKVENGEMFNISSFMNGTINNIDGRIDNILGYALIPTSGGIFARVTFEAKNIVGSADINFIPEVCYVVDPENNPYPLVFTNATVEVRNPPVYINTTPLYNITKDKATIDIYLDPNGNEISVAGFDVKFNPEYFEVTNVSYGEMFDMFLPNLSYGSVGIWGIQFNTSPPVTQPGLFASIEFEGKATGISEIEMVNVDIRDINNQTLPFITQNATLEADLTPPETTLTIGDPRYNDWITSSTPITLSATDVGSGVNKTYYKIDDGDWIEYDEPFTVSGEGMHTIYYYSIDNLGNTETEKSKVVYVDTTPPVTTLEIGEPKYENYILPTTPIYINATDSKAGVKEIHYIIDGGAEQIIPSNEITLTIEDNGRHVIEYWAVDLVGNEEEHHFITVYVDNTPPETTLTIGDPRYNDWITSSTPITLSATDVGSGVNKTYYKIDDGDWIEYTAPFTVSGEGEHTIYYYSIDNLGNTETEKSKVVYVDTTPPVTTHSLQGTLGDNNWYRSNVVVSLNSTDARSGVNKIYYRIGNGAWTIYNDSFTISSEGHTTIYYYSIDKLGNREAEKNITVKIDKSAPSADHTLAGTLVGEKYITDVIIYFTASDGFSGVKEIRYKIDGTSYIIAGLSGSHTVSSEGTHTVEYYAVDNAGNTGSARTFSFTIQKNKPPVANFTYSPLQPYTPDTITFADRSTDEDGQVVNYTWDFGDGNISYERNPRHKYADNGTYIVRLTVTDDKGATNSYQQIIVVRNKPPTALISYLPEKPKPKEDINFTSLSTDEDGSIVNYTWDFGDGNISYVQNPKHAYEREGKYNVTLTVKDNDGDTSTKTIQIEVKAEKINIWLYLIIIVVLVIIAIAVFAIWKKKRQRRGKDW